VLIEADMKEKRDIEAIPGKLEGLTVDLWVLNVFTRM
jgi:hypothetical protein